MAGEWATASLGELCDFRAGSVFKPALQGQPSGRFPFVKVSDMNLAANAVRIQDANNWISEDDLRELRAKPFPPGTVVFAKIGEAIRQNRLRQVVSETIVDNNMMGAMPHSNRVDACFFYYALSQFDFSDIAQGTALPYLTVSSLSALTLKVPPIYEQRAIAHILGTLDDKIELNRRMNETLETIAQALFKSWFVDAAQDGLLDGWREGKIEELLILSRETISPSEFPNETFDHYSIPAFDEERLPKSELGKQILSNKFLVPPDAAMISKLNPRIPRAWLPLLSDEHRSLASTEFLIAVAKSGATREWLYGLLCSQKFLDVFATLVTGTSGSHQRVKPEYLLAMNVEIPPQRCITEYTAVTKPLHDRIALNLQESCTLAALRDTLLPKLISGELRVKGAEHFLEGIGA